jgi:hypothetical protein
VLAHEATTSAAVVRNAAERRARALFISMTVSLSFESGQ